MDIDATKIGTNSLIAAQNKQIENLGKKIQELQGGSDEIYTQKMHKTLETIEEVV